MLQQKWHIYPLEDITEQERLKKKLIVFPKMKAEPSPRTVSEAANTAKSTPNLGSPGYPCFIFVTVGVVISLVLGDASG